MRKQERNSAPFLFNQNPSKINFVYYQRVTDANYIAYTAREGGWIQENCSAVYIADLTTKNRQTGDHLLFHRSSSYKVLSWVFRTVQNDAECSSTENN